jgi:hypothetical protein
MRSAFRLAMVRKYVPNFSIALSRSSSTTVDSGGRTVSTSRSTIASSRACFESK